MSWAVRAARRSIVPEAQFFRSPSVSFSLITGTAPSSRSAARVSRAFSQRAALLGVGWRQKRLGRRQVMGAQRGVPQLDQARLSGRRAGLLVLQRQRLRLA